MLLDDFFANREMITILGEKCCAHRIRVSGSTARREEHIEDRPLADRSQMLSYQLGKFRQ